VSDIKKEIDKIIQSKTNFSKLKYEIQIIIEQPVNANQFPNMNFTFKKIDILCIEKEFTTFMNINSEIKEIINEIEKLESTYFVSFIFENSYIKFWNENINLDWHISFKECKINVNVQDVHLDEIYLLSKNFHNCKFENLSLLSSVNIVHIDLDFNNIVRIQLVKIEILDNEINKIEIKNSQINQITILQSTFKRDFSIYNSKISSIKIENVDFNSLSEFINVEFTEKFDFQEITYKGFALFDDCVFNAKVEFKHIIFEKFTAFRNSTFNQGINLDYTSSDKDVNFYGVKGLDSKISKQNTSQETYRIIKNQFEKLNNKIEANKYHALELDQRKKELEKNKWQNFSEYLVFKIHDMSSKHSTNWVRALLWIFIVGSFSAMLSISVKFLFLVPILFLIFKLSLIASEKFENRILIITAICLSCVVFDIDTVFKYINILSKIEDFGCSYVAMTLNKVSLGYLYYQFLTAVRKDTRK